MKGCWRTWVAQIATLYRSAALVTFGVILVLVLLNLGLGTIYLLRDRFWQDEPQVDLEGKFGHNRSVDLGAYSRLSPSQVEELLDDQDAFTNKGFLYTPWVQFHAPEFHGRWLHTDSSGYRTTKAPRSSSREHLKVFVFGGSTTFGYGVSDEHTIPSYLQTIWDEGDSAESVVVSNYAQAYYYSSQEMQVFLKLIKQGIVPAYAIFIDGLNEVGLRTQRVLGYDEPWFTPDLTALWDAQRASSRQVNPVRRDGVDDGALLARLPMVRFARSIAARVWPQSISGVEDISESKRSLQAMADPGRVGREVEAITSVYLSNMTMIHAVCREYRIKCSFVWQPVPFYKYDKKFLRNPDIRIRPHWQQVFGAMSKIHRNDFLYLGDMLEQSSTRSYVDQVHYNEHVNEEIARAIYRFVHLDRKL